MKDKISNMKKFVQNHKTGITAASGVAVGVVMGVHYARNANYECLLTTTDEHLKTIMENRTLGIVFEAPVGKMTLRAVEEW